MREQSISKTVRISKMLNDRLQKQQDKISKKVFPYRVSESDIIRDALSLGLKQMEKVR